MAAIPHKIKIGTWVLGHRRCDVFGLTNEYNSHVIMCPGNDRVTEIGVGFIHDDWESVLDGALHEVLECALLDLECAFEGVGSYNKGTDNRLFILNHDKFSEAVSRTASFMRHAVPALSAAYAKSKRKPKKLTKKKR